MSAATAYLAESAFLAGGLGHRPMTPPISRGGKPPRTGPETERTTEVSINQQLLLTKPTPTAARPPGTILLLPASVRTGRLGRPRQVYPSRLAKQYHWPARKRLRTVQQLLKTLVMWSYPTEHRLSKYSANQPPSDR